MLPRRPTDEPAPRPLPIRTDGCPAFNLSADPPWNRCQRDRDHEGLHRDYFDRRWA